MSQKVMADKDQVFMSLAYEVAKESDDPKAAIDHHAAVGVVITREGEVLGRSANRFPSVLRGTMDHLKPTSAERYFVLEHAERCAIFDACITGKRIQRATMYCTRFPCIDCARAIAYFEFSRLVVGTGFRHEKRWIDSQRAALQLLRESGVRIRFMGRFENVAGRRV